jgi:hypothetical protein
MGKKYYVHPSAELRDGKWVCPYCLKELPQDLCTDFPCSVSVKQPFDSEIEVNVWNCEARVVVKGEIVDPDKLPMCKAMKLVRLAVDSVEASGGAINMSGIYPPSNELCEYVEQLRKRGQLQWLT